MKENIELNEIQDLILEIRGQKVLLDSDVAVIYGVETKRINEAVINNIEKFPQGYIIELDFKEKKELVENFDRFNKLKHSTVNIKGFTEKGLYMLATILKSKQAIQATFTIIETFSKFKELTRNINSLSEINTKEEQNKIMQKSGNLFADLFDSNLNLDNSETSFEINFAVLKFKHTLNKKKD